MEIIKHFSHHHNLMLKSAEFPYYCKGCNEVGFGPCYTCENENYNFFLHEDCAMACPTVYHPFSTKCVLQFKSEGSGCGSQLCDACGLKVKGFHYECSCSFVRRNLHPFCLKYKRTLETADGLTLNLSKTATSSCLHCDKKYLRFRVSGWAYVSTCGDYCFHLACVSRIINDEWKRCTFTGNADPFQVVRQKLPSVAAMQQMVRKRKENGALNKFLKVGNIILNLIISFVTGNPSGMLGAVVRNFASN